MLSRVERMNELTHHTGSLGSVRSLSPVFIDRFIVSYGLRHNMEKWCFVGLLPGFSTTLSSFSTRRSWLGEI